MHIATTAGVSTMATDKELIGVDTACVITVMFHSLFPQWVDTVLFSDILLKKQR